MMLGTLWSFLPPRSYQYTLFLPLFKGVKFILEGLMCILAG